MELTEEHKNLINKAVKRYGVTGLARKLGVTRYVFYDIQRRGRGLTQERLDAIMRIMEPEEATKSERTIETLIIQELPKLSEEQLQKLYRACVELQIKG